MHLCRGDGQLDGGAQQLGQCGGPVAEDGHQLAGLDVQADAAHGVHGAMPAGPEVLDELSGFDHVLDATTSWCQFLT